MKGFRKKIVGYPVGRIKEKAWQKKRNFDAGIIDCQASKEKLLWGGKEFMLSIKKKKIMRRYVVRDRYIH